MYSADNRNPRRNQTPAAVTPTGRTRPRGRVRSLALMCAGAVLSCLTLNARADIYLYDGNGTPVNVTASYTYQEHYVYDSLNNLVGTVDAAGHIFNLSNELIGYMTADPGGPHN